MTPWVVLCLVGAVPVEDTVAAGALGWLEVPAVSRTVAQLESSPAAPLCRLVVPRAERALVKEGRDTRVVAAVYPAATGGPLEWIVGADAGGMAGALRERLRGWLAGRGLAPGEARPAAAGATQALGRGGVTLFWAGTRLGLASAPARAERALGASAAPLSAAPEYRRLAQLAPGDPRASLDVQRLYGVLARGPRGRTLAGLVDRLGLLDARTLSATLSLDHARGVLARGELAIAGEPKGLRAALGPAVIPARPGAMPPGAVGFARVSVRPDRLYALAQILASYEAPLETSLVRANVEALEARLGKRVGADLLGDAPRQWTLVFTDAGGLGTAVLLADVASGPVASAFLEELVGVLPGLFPDLEARKTTAGGKPVWTLSAARRELLALGVRRDTVIVGPTAAAVVAQLRRAPPADAPTGEPAAVAYGTLSRAAVERLLEDTAAGQRLLDAGGARRLTAGQLTSGLGAVSFGVAPAEAGYAWSVVLAPR